MEISMDTDGIIVLKGNLVVSNIESVHSSLEPFLEESSHSVVIDLSHVEEIDISGLQLLYSLKKSYCEEGAMLIKAMSQQVRDILDISGFSLALKEAMP